MKNHVGDEWGFMLDKNIFWDERAFACTFDGKGFNIDSKPFCVTSYIPLVIMEETKCGGGV